MEVLSEANRVRDEAMEKLRGERLERTTGLESRRRGRIGEGEEKKMEAQRCIRELKQEVQGVREELKEACEVFWQNMDRYL